MEDHYAVVADGTVVNVIVWDGVQPYDPGEGLTLVPLPYSEGKDGVRRYTGGIGWDYDGENFIDNRPTEQEL